MVNTIDDKIDDKKPACMGDGNSFAYTKIGGTACSAEVCYKHFKEDQTCPYLNVKNDKQYCKVYEK